MFTKRVILITLAVVAVIASAREVTGGLLSWPPAHRHQPLRAEHPARVNDDASVLAQSPAEEGGVELSGSGIIQSQADVVLSAEVSGRVVAVNAREGDEVTAGSVLIQLDDEMLQAKIAQAQIEVEVAKAQLARVKAGARPQEIEAAQADVESARAQVEAAQATVDAARANLEATQARLRMAQAKYALLAAGPTDLELQIAQKQIELAKIRLWAAQAQRDATRDGMHMPLSIPLNIEGVDLGTIVILNPVGPKQFDVEAAEAAIVEADKGIRLAEVQYERLKAGVRPEDLAVVRAEIDQAQAEVEKAQIALEKAQQAVETARAQWEQAQAQLDLLLAGPRAEEIALMEAQVAQAQAEVTILEAQREKLSLSTPITGLVTERTVHEGEVVVAGARLLTISNLDPVILTIYIPETHIGHLQVGQTAEVFVSAYPDRTFRGEVTHIASRAEFTPRNIQTREERTNVVFAVRIKIPNPERLLRPGMPAEAVLR